MRRPHLERRSKRYAAKQSLSDVGMHKDSKEMTPRIKIAKPYDEELIYNLLRTIAGESADREGLQETPKRFINALQFYTSGYHQDPAEVLKCFEDGGQGYDELVFQSNIAIFSTCEHHLSPMFGVAHIGYIPNGKIVGLSKLARVLEIFTRRLTVQERITTQVADSLMENLQPLGAAVVLQLRHLCLESRGVQKIGTITQTVALRGAFMTKPEARAEFISLVATK